MRCSCGPCGPFITSARKIVGGTDLSVFAGLILRVGFSESVLQDVVRGAGRVAAEGPLGPRDFASGHKERVDGNPGNADAACELERFLF